MQPTSSRLDCPSCGRSLEFFGEPPKFCGYCGKPLATALAANLVHEAVTAPPRNNTAATTEPPAPATPAANDGVPETVGGYRLLRRLGGGGMGSVYEAEDVGSGRRVALKLILPEYAESPDAVERFRQEGRLASSLAHPRCVFVLAADEVAGQPYIVMELMPGKTLDDLVQEQGPLPPDVALTKILDVVNGLREAHQLGLVHRDVKPSNCFLEADGRVKIGDFGLAKSLMSQTKLTHTGTFIGTPLFASPEQVKLETVDAQSDVYSVAATLYFLLTGKAPHQTGDTLATLARIVSDDPPPMRSLRPEIPKALDRVVLRGLERDRKRRYRDLDEFRSALLPFLPIRPSIGGIGLRFVAFLIDSFLVWLMGTAIENGLIVPAVRFGVLPTLSPPMYTTMYQNMTGILLFLLYFGLLEGHWGWSLGKRLLRLQVGTVAGNRPPGIGSALLRAFVVITLSNLMDVANPFLWPTADVNTMMWPGADHPTGGTRFTEEQTTLILVNTAWSAVALIALLSTMRASTGYRGLHEVLSGTRTYQIRSPQPRKRQGLKGHEFRPPVTQEVGVHERIGPFRVLGVLHHEDRERILLAEDPQLGRSLWVWLRPIHGPVLGTADRDVNRGTRVRWLAGGTDGDWLWDAFLAPDGIPLCTLAAGKRRLTWTEVRPVLEDLTEELAAGVTEGNLPDSLTLPQLWVRPNGRVLLLGSPLAAVARRVAGWGGDEVPPGDAGNDVRALDFLRRVAVTALEGGPRQAMGTPVRAPVPVHAARHLNRLLGVRKPYSTIEEWQTDLESTRDRPTEVSRLRRASHLALTALLLHVPFLGPWLFLLVTLAALMVHWENVSKGSASDAHNSSVMIFGFISIGVCVTFWVGWAFLFRGGYAYFSGGIALRRSDGRKPTRLQCGYRAFLVWGPVACLFTLAIAVAHAFPFLPWLYLGIWGCGVLLLIGYSVHAIRSPTRALHDRLAGTYLVPD